jgi:RNA 2',3'-cyclic 3'-phosphodiesterase
VPAEPWRLFFALPVPAELARESEVLLAPVRVAYPRARWVPLQNLHLTLAFVGATDPARVPAIVDAAKGVATGTPSFWTANTGVGSFGRRGERTVWLGLEDADGDLGALAAGLGLAAGIGGDDAGRPFRAHLTLVRAADRDVEGAVRLALDGLPRMEWLVTAVDLLRSHLGGGPPRYELISSLPLGAPPAGATIAPPARDAAGSDARRHPPRGDR